MILNYIQPLELDTSPANLNDLLHSTLEGLRDDFMRHEVTLDLDLATRLPEISLDQKLIKQVLEALVRNALMQMPKGSRLTIQTLLEDDIPGLSKLYSAQHLSEDDVEHFFYPFTSPKVAFGAMDPPMCKIIVNKHGGAINVHLDPIKELVIRITLPPPSDRSKTRQIM
jgi:K+-sensing histidine kinase KdpD